VKRRVRKAVRRRRRRRKCRSCRLWSARVRRVSKGETSPGALGLDHGAVDEG
jgi:hypothetical protein